MDDTAVSVSPWRSLFERVRGAIGTQRDEHGVIGSINWLRQAMSARGANPNVVRNIIYRDKGRLPDKQALYAILNELWRGAGNGPLELPELEAILAPVALAEQEVLQLMGREKRRAYQAMLSGVRRGEMPKVLVIGRSGSGKTLLTDYVQQGLELAEFPADCLRLEFGTVDLATSLSRLGAKLGIQPELIESRLVRIATASAYAVQADAQAEVARTLLEAVTRRERPLALLLHLSRGLTQQDSLGLAPLRLNTQEVPRVNGAEWLWVTLIEPLARLPHVALFVTIADLPARAMQRLGQFGDPYRLAPPTAADARRFVRARVPHLPAEQQEEIIRRAGRSFEELRTLTLLAQAREDELEGDQGAAHYIEQLGRLVEQTGDPELRSFLASLAILAMPDFPNFEAEVLQAVQGGQREMSSFELSFLDPVPGEPGEYRSFSRRLTRELKSRLKENDPAYYRQVNRRAATAYAERANASPTGDFAARYLHHLFEARDWAKITRWLATHVVSHALVRRIWQAAQAELLGREERDLVAREVAAHYVKLGAYEHPDALRAFEALTGASNPELRAWTHVKRAEGEVLAGRFERAQALLDTSPTVNEPLIRAEAALARASILRWRGDLAGAARVIANEAQAELRRVKEPTRDPETRLVFAKATVWEGLIAKDQGDLEAALRAFEAATTEDDLVNARIEFQRGDAAMRLGRFGAALTALNRAALLSERAEALAQERARYLARRGTAHRLMGELHASQHDFRAARQLLETAELPDDELAFWRAKIDDEAAHTALALGDFEEATYLITHALAAFRAYAAAAGGSAAFRALRGTLNLATAYACRGVARPYRYPFPVLGLGGDGPDLNHARSRIAEVIAALKNEAHYRQDLKRQALILASQFAADEREGARFAERALSLSRFDNQRAHALTARAAANARGGAPTEALADVKLAAEALARAEGDDAIGDRSLRAQLASLRSAAHLIRGDEQAAAEALADALENPDLAAHHEDLLRAFGEAADALLPETAQELRGGGWKSHRRLRVLLGVDGTGPSTPARLPDALVAAWRSRDPLRQAS